MAISPVSGKRMSQVIIREELRESLGSTEMGCFIFIVQLLLKFLCKLNLNSCNRCSR